MDPMSPRMTQVPGTGRHAALRSCFYSINHCSEEEFGILPAELTYSFMCTPFLMGYFAAIWCLKENSEKEIFPALENTPKKDTSPKTKRPSQEKFPSRK